MVVDPEREDDPQTLSPSQAGVRGCDNSPPETPPSALARGSARPNCDQAGRANRDPSSARTKRGSDTSEPRPAIAVDEVDERVQAPATGSRPAAAYSSKPASRHAETAVTADGHRLGLRGEHD